MLKSRHQFRSVWLAVIILSLATAVQCIGAWQDSQTIDEAAHLAAGRSYWQTGDFRLNPEHPPLIKLLAALPLLAEPSTRINTSAPDWVARDEWSIGTKLLYGPTRTLRQAQTVMFIGRLPMILVWATLGWLLFIWARRRWGSVAGIVSLIVFAFDPNFLGHGHLVTTDVGITLGFFATIWLLDTFLRRPDWLSLAWLSLVFGLTQVTKFSAIILWAIVPLVSLIALTYRSTQLTTRWWWRLIGGLVLVSGIVTWSVYGFELRRIDADPRIAELWQQRQTIVDAGTIGDQPPAIQHLIRWTDPETSTGRLAIRVSHLTIPAYSYWRGIFTTLTHDIWGHPAYLLGQTSPGGWWYYFPLALVVKTPAVTLGLLVLALGFGISRLFRSRSTTERIPFDAWVLGLPPLVYFAWSLTSHINIGFRHIFPIEPFLFLAVGSLASVATKLPPARWKTILVVLSCGVPLTAALTWPNTIGYFSEIVGGPRQGYRYLLDSNLDWNQDVWRLDRLMTSEHWPEVHMSLFGSIPYRTLWPNILPVLTDQNIAAGQHPSGVVVISANLLDNPDFPFAWLQTYTPSWRVGSSLSVFDFR